METTKDEIVKSSDPKTALPSELFFKSLSYLGPFSIASSSAVSRGWKDSLRSNPNLHREIDLGHLNEEFEISFILYHFSQLSQLSLHSLTKVTINLGAFLLEVSGPRKAPNVKFGKSISHLDVFFSILQQSSKTLREVHLYSRIGESLYEIDPRNPRRPFLNIIKQLQSYPSLQVLNIVAPTSFNLEAGGVGPGSKRFSLTHYEGAKEEWYSVGVPNVVGLIKEVKKLVGSERISVLEPSNRNPGANLQARTPFQALGELEHSRATLQRLGMSNLYLQDQLPFWELAFQCSNMKSLVLEAFEIHPQIQTHMRPLDFPRGDGGSVGMEKLVLKLRCYSVNWASFPSWFGSSLQELVLDVDDYRRSGYTAPVIPGTLLLNCRETIKVLHIKNATLETGLEPLLVFPQLQSFCLSQVGPLVYQFSTKCELPRLQKLKIESEKPRESINLVKTLLSKYATQLVHLSLLFSKDSSPFSEIHPYKFCNLRRLSLSENWHCAKWLSNSTFPVLHSIFAQARIQKMFWSASVYYRLPEWDLF